MKICGCLRSIAYNAVVPHFWCPAMKNSGGRRPSACAGPAGASRSCGGFAERPTASPDIDCPSDTLIVQVYVGPRARSGATVGTASRLSDPARRGPSRPSVELVVAPQRDQVAVEVLADRHHLGLQPPPQLAHEPLLGT